MVQVKVVHNDENFKKCSLDDFFPSSVKFNEKQLCYIHECELGAQTVTEHHLCADVFLFGGTTCFWMNVPAKQLHISLAQTSFLWGKRWENMGFL